MARRRATRRRGRHRDAHRAASCSEPKLYKVLLAQRRLHDHGVRGGGAAARVPPRRSRRRMAIMLHVHRTESAWRASTPTRSPRPRWRQVMALAREGRVSRCMCTMEPETTTTKAARMTMTITKELEATIQLAFDEARRRRHEYVTLEHLLFALTQRPGGGEDPEGVRRRPEEAASELERSSTRTCAELPEGDGDARAGADTAFRRVLQRAAMHVQCVGQGAHRRRQPAGRVLPRARLARGVPAREAGRAPARRAQLRRARHRRRIARTRRRRERAAERRRGRRDRRRRGRAASRPRIRSRPTPSTWSSSGARARSIR